MLDISSIWGWLGLGGGTIAILGLVAWFFPPFRKLALSLIAVIFAALTVYGKGYRDRGKEEQKKKDEAVNKTREGYEKIDNRIDTVDDVDKRLRNGDF